MNSPPKTTPPVPGLRERKKAKTRAAIRTHALELFRQHGYATTTVEQICDAAEVSYSTFFRYFPSKEDVVLQDDYDPLILAALRAQPPELTAVQATLAAAHAVFNELTEEELERERERAALIASVPELRTGSLERFSETTAPMLAEVLAERTGCTPGDPSVRSFIGAMVGIAVAALLSTLGDPNADYFELLELGFAQLENGFAL
jgi:AcrR family transcriptional regulator